ncbi:hypothetical protein AB1Y20_023414 [Prymnesium parvum]|uniref:Uncharacterized protein n=1 Tax=Prymnesium parvum TaxID=97485 RepID=A0AB34JEE7_PRYPA
MLCALLLLPCALLPAWNARAPPLPAARPLARSLSPRACASASEEDGGDFQVVLRDDETNRTIACQLLETTEVLGRLYASMTPVDTPVAITRIEDGVMVELDGGALFDELLPTAQAVASEMGLSLQHTAVTLTVSGDLEGHEEFDESALGLDELPSVSFAERTHSEALEAVEDEDDDELGEDGAEVLLSFGHKKQTYYIVRLLEPLFVVGRQEKFSEFVLPDELEMRTVGPILEDLMTRNAEYLEDA